MSTLFTINKAPSHRLLEQCLHAASAGDCILFLEDGVYYGAKEKTLDKIPDNIEVFCLKEDLLARGLLDRLVQRSQTASYRRFVQLCVDHQKVVNWF